MSERLLQRPSDFNNEPGTWLAGRVVIMRSADLMVVATKMRLARRRESLVNVKARVGGEPAGDTGDRYKCELHLLGSSGMSEVVFFWSLGRSREKSRDISISSTAKGKER